MVLNLSVFEASEYEFLQEYHRVMKCIASALKAVEADKYTFGLFLPTLFGIRVKLEKLKEHVKYCLPLVEVLQQCLEERFGNLMDIFASDGKSIPGFVAMVSNPMYKLNYIGLNSIPSHYVLRVKQMLVDAGMNIQRDKMERAQMEVSVQRKDIAVQDDKNGSWILEYFSKHFSSTEF